MRKLDFDRLRVAQRESALAEVKGSILLDRIADAEHTEVTDRKSKISFDLSPCKAASRSKPCALV